MNGRVKLFTTFVRGLADDVSEAFMKKSGPSAQSRFDLAMAQIKQFGKNPVLADDAMAKPAQMNVFRRIQDLDLHIYDRVEMGVRAIIKKPAVKTATIPRSGHQDMTIAAEGGLVKRVNHWIYNKNSDGGSRNMLDTAWRWMASSIVRGAPFAAAGLAIKRWWNDDADKDYKFKAKGHDVVTDEEVARVQNARKDEFHAIYSPQVVTYPEACDKELLMAEYQLRIEKLIEWEIKPKDQGGAGLVFSEREKQLYVNACMKFVEKSLFGHLSKEKLSDRQSIVIPDCALSAVGRSAYNLSMLEERAHQTLKNISGMTITEDPQNPQGGIKVEFAWEKKVKSQKGNWMEDPVKSARGLATDFVMGNVLSPVTDVFDSYGQPWTPKEIVVPSEYNTQKQGALQGIKSTLYDWTGISWFKPDPEARTLAENIQTMPDARQKMQALQESFNIRVNPSEAQRLPAVTESEYIAAQLRIGEIRSAYAQEKDPAFRRKLELEAAELEYTILRYDRKQEEYNAFKTYTVTNTTRAKQEKAFREYRDGIVIPALEKEAETGKTSLTKAQVNAPENKLAIKTYANAVTTSRLFDMGTSDFMRELYTTTGEILLQQYSDLQSTREQMIQAYSAQAQADPDFQQMTQEQMALARKLKYLGMAVQ